MEITKANTLTKRHINQLKLTSLEIIAFLDWCMVNDPEQELLSEELERLAFTLRFRSDDWIEGTSDGIEGLNNAIKNNT